MATHPLSDIVDVNVNVSPISAARSGFDLGLIIGESTHISAVTRVVEYASLSAMLTAGFIITDPEYVAAVKFFAATSRPSKVLIGRQDTGETPVQAITACRLANDEWYAITVCGATKSEIIAAAAYVETCSPPSVLFYTTSDADAKAGTAGNIFVTLKTSGYRRSIGQWSSTADAVASIMGYAMGANTGNANSAYTLKFKSETGVTPDTLTSAELAFVQADRGNAYVIYGATYNLFIDGIMASGVYFDEVLGIDQLTNDIQMAVMNLLVSNLKIPQTEDGVNQIINAITIPCQNAVTRGFVAPGVWTAANVKSLLTGDALPAGYIIQADTISSQSDADRAARIAPPIYVAVKLAGAIQEVVITIDVNR